MLLQLASVQRTLLLILLCTLAADSSFINSKSKLERDGVSDASKLRFVQKELNYISEHLSVPVRQQYAKCAVVGTSEELYASQPGSSIDSADIVVRVGYNQRSIIKTYRDSSGALQTNTDATEGRHTDVAGMKLDYIFLNVNDLKSAVDALVDSIYSQNAVVVTVLHSIRDIRSLYNFMLNAPNVPLALLSARSIDIMWSNTYAHSDSSPTDIFYGVNVCRQLTQHYPIEVYGGYTVFQNAFIEDSSFVTSNADSACSAPSHKSSSDSSWTALTLDPGVQLMNKDWHDSLYKKMTSKKITPATFNEPLHCPMRLSQRPFKSCAVVGAAPHIGCYKQGSEIDAHDAIFRTNSHLPIVNKTDIMGSRTTHVLFQASYFVNDLHKSGCARVLPTDDSVVICSSKKAVQTLFNSLGLLANFNSTLLKHWSSAGFENHLKTNYDNPATQFSTFVNNLSKPNAYIKSTTGMMAVVYAMDLCKSIDVYGFSVGNVQLGVHSYILEMMVLRTLELECEGRFNIKLPDETNYKRYIDAWRAMPMKFLSNEDEK